MLMFQQKLGIMGQFFHDLAYTIIFSLMCSLFVAICLVPVLTSKYLRIDKIIDVDHASDIAVAQDFINGK